jgi:SAM-dependent methyltransferase
MTPPPISGATAKAQDLLTAIRTLKQIEQDHRPATEGERHALLRFPGFGPLARAMFPDVVTGRYPHASWHSLGEALRTLLTPDEYASAKRATFTAFYTSPLVIGAMYDALIRLGVPTHATVLEPGCGSGNFLRLAPAGMCFIGVELDSLSGRIAKALFPAHDIRIENFRDTRLPADRIDAVIGNVPFADVKLAYGGQRLALHEFFFAKSLDALKPGGLLALLTTHYTLDKHNAGVRASLADRADFLGAIRLPSDAFKREGTSVVTDMVFLRKRAPGEPARHADPEWLQSDPLLLDGEAVPINRYFLRHPEMVLGTWSRKTASTPAPTVRATRMCPSSYRTLCSACRRTCSLARRTIRRLSCPLPVRHRRHLPLSPKEAFSSATIRPFSNGRTARRSP